MKCPKCGFNSFEGLDSCKKCGRDLGEHKKRFGLDRLGFFRHHKAPPANAGEPIPFSATAKAAGPLGEDVAESAVAGGAERGGGESGPEVGDEAWGEGFLASLDGEERGAEAPEAADGPLAVFSLTTDAEPGVLAEQTWKSEPAPAPGGSPFESSGVPLERGPAELKRRLGAAVVDVLLLVVVFGLFLLAGIWGLDANRQSFSQSGLPASLAGPYFLVLFFLCFGYFTLFHYFGGQTPGKMLFRVRVEDEDGTGLGWSQAFLRSTGGVLSLLVAGFGFLQILVQPGRRSWSDRLAGTRVVAEAQRRR